LFASIKINPKEGLPHMMRFTIYKLQQVKTLEEVNTILQEHAVLDEPYTHPKWPDDEELQRRFFGGTEGISFKAQSHMVGEDEVRFIYVGASSERAKRASSWFDDSGKLRPHDERVSQARAHMLFFKRAGIVYCAIQTQTLGTLLHLKNDLFLPEYWGGLIDATEYHVDTDFFYWALERFMRHAGELSKGLKVTNLSAYHAETLEETHTLMGQGERVTQLLPTLANIFGNDPFRSMRLEVKLGKDSSVFTFNRSGGVAIEDGLYKGPFAGDTHGDVRRAIITYYIYTVLLPFLISEYRRYGKTEWSPKVRERFVHGIGVDMLARIADKLGLDRANTLEHYLGQIVAK
jgi:hypothetical protein